MKETLLIYNINDKKTQNALQFLAVRMNIRVRLVKPEQYKMPLGLLAFGSARDQEEYLKTPDSNFEDTMLVFAGFSNQQLNDFLKQMAKNRIPSVPLKAVLTEHNAVWDSLALHDELVEEHTRMHE